MAVSGQSEGRVYYLTVPLTWYGRADWQRQERKVNETIGVK